MKKINLCNILLDILFVLISVMCIYPVLLVIGISFTDETALADFGFKVIPKVWSLGSYRYIVTAGNTILRAYGITAAVTIIGAVSSTLVVALYAYPLSRTDFAYRKLFMFMAFFTMLFSGGVVSWYMICTNVLHLKNSIWAMILPYIMNAWHVIVMRSFFTMSLPGAIIESAKIDGAGEVRTFVDIVFPMIKPGVGALAIFTFINAWNDYFLQLIMLNSQSKLTISLGIAKMQAEASTDFGLIMAGATLASVPIITIFLIFQKYFTKGITLGAVKG